MFIVKSSSAFEKSRIALEKSKTGVKKSRTGKEKSRIFLGKEGKGGNLRGKKAQVSYAKCLTSDLRQ